MYKTGSLSPTHLLLLQKTSLKKGKSNELFYMIFREIVTIESEAILGLVWRRLGL